MSLAAALALAAVLVTPESGAVVTSGGGVYPFPGYFYDYAPTPDRTIEVTGTGEVNATPDQALVTLVVETTGASGDDATRRNVVLSEDLVRTLSLRHRIGKQNFEQSGPRVRPQEDGLSVATNRITVRTRNLPQLGALVDSALEAGAARLEGVSYQLTEVDSLRDQAVKRAIAQAEESAESTARSLGVRLGDLIEARTEQTPEAPPSGDAASLTPPSQTVSAEVRLVYRIRRF